MDSNPRSPAEFGNFMSRFRGDDLTL